MATENKRELSGAIFDESSEITIVELCRVCSVDAHLVEELIAEGILEPKRRNQDSPMLPYSAVRRTRMVVRMQRDLGVNLAGAALALDLIERIRDLQSKLHMR